MLTHASHTIGWSMMSSHRFFPTNVSPGASVHEDIEVVARAASIPPDEPSFVGFLNGHLHIAGLVVELSTDVNIRCTTETTR